MPQRKPKRRTRDRALETALRLFNEFGEPNVTTTTIAGEMNISPGNLYYHFRNKDEIVNEILVGFRREIGQILSVPAGRRVTVEDMWLFLHLMFETIWRYRFVYRDLNDLLTRNRLLEIHFKGIIQDKVRTIGALCEGLALEGDIQIEGLDVSAFATNMTLLMTYWLSFAYVRDPRHFVESNVVAHGVYQVMSIVAPHLRGSGRQLFEQLAREYLDR